MTTLSILLGVTLAYAIVATMRLEAERTARQSDAAAYTQAIASERDAAQNAQTEAMLYSVGLDRWIDIANKHAADLAHERACNEQLTQQLHLMHAAEAEWLGSVTQKLERTQ